MQLPGTVNQSMPEQLWPCPMMIFHFLFLFPYVDNVFGCLPGNALCFQAIKAGKKKSIHLSALPFIPKTSLIRGQMSSNTHGENTHLIHQQIC